MRGHVIEYLEQKVKALQAQLEEHRRDLYRWAEIETNRTGENKYFASDIIMNIIAEKSNLLERVASELNRACVTPEDAEVFHVPAAS